jgi:hypothetical protein
MKEVMKKFPGASGQIWPLSLDANPMVVPDVKAQKEAIGYGVASSARSPAARALPSRKTPRRAGGYLQD